MGEMAGALGRAARGMLWDPVRDRAVAAAAANLKLTLALLLTGAGFVVTVVVLPVLVIVFAMSAGISHGLRLESPAAAPPGPPLAPGELACP
ncbi:MAG TPA: hypothetical protein VGO86_10910, partial [Candidatus Dormibacteraeota bacterium]